MRNKILFNIILIGFLFTHAHAQMRMAESELPEAGDPFEDFTWITVGNPDTLSDFRDTLIEDLEKYDPARRFETAAMGLGNIGSSQYAVEWHPRQTLQTVPGFNQYELYKLELDDFRHYNLSQPYNDLYFSPGGGKNSFVVGARFSRDFSGDVNVSLDYKRYLQQGYYQNQQTKSTAFGVGIWKADKEKKHDLFLTFIANNHNEEINGGVTTDTLFQQELYDLRAAIPVRLEGDTTRHQSFSYSMDNYLREVGGILDLHHRIRYMSGFFRFGDHITEDTADSLVYRSYLNDSRGLRYFLGFNRLINAFDMGFRESGIGLKIGLSHAYQRYDNTIDIMHVHDLTLSGSLAINMGSFSAFKADAAIGAGSNAGNLDAETVLEFNGIQGLNISGRAFFKRYDPSLIEQQVIVNQKEIFSADFSKTQVIGLGGALNWEMIDTRLSIRTGILENAVGWDEKALPYQSGERLEYFQLKFSHVLRFGPVGLQNQLLYQEFSEDIFRLPDLYTIHNVFVETRLFNRTMLSRFGILYYHTNYKGALSFMPVTGIFYPAEATQPSYPYAEFYSNFKVDNFRLFFKIENLAELLGREVHYQVLDYPQFDYKLRIGIRWILFS